MKNVLVLLILLVGCSRESPSPSVDSDLSTRDADVAVCIACGMVVREQPAPRGQVVHRDGTRVFLCSLGDLLRYLDIPSPHGKPQAIYAECLAPNHALEDLDRRSMPWHPVAELSFVIDIDRPGVMGAPVMTYQTREAAERAAITFHGEAVSFTQLQERYTQ